MTNRTLTITAADGTVLDLIHPFDGSHPGPGGPYHLGDGLSLWSPPSPVFDEQSAAFLPGATMTPTRHSTGDIVIPVKVMSAGRPEALDEDLARLMVTLDAIRGGLCRITYGRGDGATPRWIDAYLVGATSPTVTDDGQRVASTRLAFRAPSPYWSDGEPRVVDLESGSWADGSTPFNDGSVTYTDDNLFSEQELQTTTVTITGDIPVRPVWYAQGKSVDTLSIIVAGNWWRWRFDGSTSPLLATAQKAIRLDTRPRTLAANLHTADPADLPGPGDTLDEALFERSFWGEVDGDPTFSLAPGTHQIIVQWPTRSSVWMEWEPLWLTA